VSLWVPLLRNWKEITIVELLDRSLHHTFVTRPSNLDKLSNINPWLLLRKRKEPVTSMPLAYLASTYRSWECLCIFCFFSSSLSSAREQCKHGQCVFLIYTALNIRQSRVQIKIDSLHFRNVIISVQSSSACFLKLELFISGL
jgi:hypothetical protein